MTVLITLIISYEQPTQDAETDTGIIHSFLTQRLLTFVESTICCSQRDLPPLFLLQKRVLISSSAYPLSSDVPQHHRICPYNQHCINATFPPGRTQVALSFLIMTLLIPRRNLSVPSPSYPTPAIPFCLGLPFPQPFLIRALQCPRLLFLFHCPPPAWQTLRSQHSAPVQL